MPFPILPGKLEDRMGNEGSGFFVEKLVFAAPGRDGKPARAYHVVQLIRINAGGVYDTARFKGFPGCGHDAPASGCGPGQNLFYRSVEKKLRAVFKGIFRIGDRHVERADDPARGTEKGCRSLVGNGGFKFF